MTKFDKMERLRKALSILLVYALFFQEFIPFTHAMEHIANDNYVGTTLNGVYVPKHTKTDVERFADNVAETPDVDGIETSELSVAVSSAMSGGGQAESSGFSLGSTDALVNKFTGDFSYSIPLMNVEGYPIVLSYNSNVGMNSEASWVGLGWDLNVGAVSREMRGIPDEFNGEQEITRTYNQLESETFGYKEGAFVSGGYQFGSGDFTLTPSVQLTFLKGEYLSTYLGYGATFDFGLQAQLSLGNDDKNWSVGPSLGLGYSSDTKNGIGTSSTFGISGGYGKETEGLQISGDVSFGKSYNSRMGLTSKSVNTGLSFGWKGKHEEKDENGKMQTKYTGGAVGTFGTSTSLNYGTNTTVPTVSMSSKTGGYQLNTKVSVSWKVPGWKVGAGILIQIYDTDNNIILDGNQVHQPAIGYFHSGKRGRFSENVDQASYPVMDFNRSQGFEYSEEMANLDFSIQTYDIFRVNASGLSAAFRGRRTDFGTYYDASKEANTFIDSHNPSFDYQAGATTAFTLGYSFAGNKGDVESGSFTLSSDNNVLEFEQEYKGNQFDERVYFKGIGEPTPENMDAWDYMGGASPACFNMTAINPTIGDKYISQTTGLMVNSGAAVNKNSGTLNLKIDEITQANHFEPLIVENMQGEVFLTYNENDFDNANDSTVINRNDDHRDDNHLTAIKTITNDGTRYTYGIPAYDLTSSNVSFAVEGRTVDSETGLVEYNTGDNSTSNTLGRSHYFDKTTVPAYAHSFLLTEMTSSDYIDITGDGPSVDDIGAYYKFNYSQVYGEDNGNSPYKWRFPVSGGTDKEAFHNEGLLGSELDDMGNYSYGEKEVWYTHSVESKNLIAEFYLSDRLDAFAVNGEDGGLNLSDPLKALDSIVLYNRSERLNNPNATPLQVVKFEYDYSLCKNAPGSKHTYAPNIDLSKSGKLTLKKIRIYSANSEEMGLSAYDFTYSAENPEFNYADIDAWGNYKENATAKPNHIFPYAEQDETTANDNSQAWKLTSIKTPQGGQVDVEYEADRYGYVQNKRAMRHFEVYKMMDLIHFLKVMDNASYDGSEYSTTDYNTFFTTSELTTLGGSTFADEVSDDDHAMTEYAYTFGKTDIKRIPNNVIIFKLDEEYSSSLSVEDAAQKVRDEYFGDIQNAVDEDRRVYFKIHSDISINGSVKEYVPLFAQVSRDWEDAFDDNPTFEDDFEAMGVMPYASGENYKYGYVVIDPANVGEKAKKEDISIHNTYMAHPFQKAAIEFARASLPDVIYQACNGCNGDLKIDKEARGKKDVNRVMITLEYAEKLNTGLSTIRLYEPDNIKFGGNARVSKITYSDNWNTISGEYTTKYDWVYEYANRLSETGVASYESRAAKDENPLYQWNTYVNIKEKFPNESKFTPTPIGDLLYPSPIVGYGKVEVRFNGEYDTGYSESNFYTAKDYPTQEYKTAIDKEARIERKNILTGKSVNLYGFTQGYSVLTNDYHGKPLSHIIYNDMGSQASVGNIQSKTVYDYYDIDEKLKMIDREGVISEERVALEYDMHTDANFVTDNSFSFMAGLSVKWWLTPIPGFMVFPNFNMSKRERGFYANTFVKHINKSAQVKSVQTTYMQSQNSAENLAYDRETGRVVISSLKDEFDDELYSFGYPAHWYYDDFRSTSEVENFTTSGVVTDNTLTTTATMKDYLVAGDKLLIEQGAAWSWVWVLSIDSGVAKLIDSNGDPYDNLSGGVDVTILESGRENRLMESVQSVVTKKEPSLSMGQFTFPDEEILSASAMTYRDRNTLKCYNGTPPEGSIQIEEDEVVNPYLYGIKGDLVPDGSYAWQSERINATHEHGIRFDGEYNSFDPFYDVKTADQEWYTINESGHPDHSGSDLYKKWRKLGEVTWFDEYGKALESKDQINVHSAILYGYNHELGIIPVAQAINARQQEIGFDGFEDYEYYDNTSLNTQETHFNFSDVLSSSILLTDTYRHSGLSSLEIKQNKTAEVVYAVGDVCSNPGDGMQDSVFVADSCLCIPPFEPTPGKYIVSAWVKVGDEYDVTTYTDGKIEIEVGYGSPVSYSFLPSGPIIDGWQRIEGTFEFTSSADDLTFRLKNISGSEIVYFDDLRVHPFLSNMTTTVYDAKTLLPLATHDGYNFTTFYNYDENLNQVRVRVETENGIQTVSEQEFGGQKSFTAQ